MNEQKKGFLGLTHRPTLAFVILYVLLLVLLFLYTFTQIDLGLVLGNASLFEIQRAFQTVGYFNRPLSGMLFLLLIFFLFLFYGVFLFLTKKGRISEKVVWLVVSAVTLILTFSYNAFSYDIFNYIFDAKIVTQYNENPYFRKALDFPNDPMLSFMHWTHRTYPYGPTWLLVTVPLSFVGLQQFIPTFFLFKLLAGLSFIGTAYMIGKIMRKVAPKDELFAIVFFALNPLIMIESLISAHNDIVMMFLGMVSIYFLVSRRYLWSFVFLVLSAGVKYATGFLLPLFIAIFLFDRKKVKVEWQQIFLVFIVTMLFAIIAAILRTNFQPWYLLFVLPIAALVAKRFYILIPSLILSLSALLNYVPYLYLGTWDEPVPYLLNITNLGGIALSIVASCLWMLVRRKRTIR